MVFCGCMDYLADGAFTDGAEVFSYYVVNFRHLSP
jgi:hypothetical protein